MDVRFDPRLKSIFVPAVVSGPAGDLDVRLALDTGATRTVVRPSVLGRVGVDLSRPVGFVDMTSATGVVKVPRVPVRSVTALGVTRLFEVVAHELPGSFHGQGLLGRDFFAGMVLAVNFADHTVSLRPPAATAGGAVAVRPAAGTLSPSRHGFPTPHRDGEGHGMSMFIGEGLVGEGNEIAHIDLMIGDKTGPVGAAFAHALATQSEGHTNLLAVITPNVLAKPATVLITKVTIKGMPQAVQMFGPAQAAVARAVVDSVAEGVIPKDKAEDYVIVCGVFIHPKASDDTKIYEYNYEATKLSIKNAMKGLPGIDEVISKKGEKHPFSPK